MKGWQWKLALQDFTQRVNMLLLPPHHNACLDQKLTNSPNIKQTPCTRITSSSHDFKIYNFQCEGSQWVTKDRQSLRLFQ